MFLIVFTIVGLSVEFEGLKGLIIPGISFFFLAPCVIGSVFTWMGYEFSMILQKKGKRKGKEKIW